MAHEPPSTPNPESDSGGAERACGPPPNDRWHEEPRMRVTFDPKAAAEERGLWTTHEQYVRRRFARCAEEALKGDKRSLEEAKQLHENHPRLGLIP